MQKCCDISNIISLYYNQVKTYLINRTGDTNLAEDIVQETMVRLVDAYNKNINLRNPKAWLFKIAKNKLADTYREKRFFLDFDSIQEVHADKTYEDSPSDFLYVMIKRLPEKYGKPLYLSDIECKPLNEIADSFNLSLSATKMRVQRGRKMLNDVYRECCNIEFTLSGKFSDCTLKDKWVRVFEISE